MTHGQVWWPILGISVLHFNPSKVHAHSSEHTHTVNTHPEQWAARGAVGSSVPCSRAPKSWYWGWRERCKFTPPPHLQFLPDLTLKLTTFRLKIQLFGLQPLGRDFPTNWSPSLAELISTYNLCVRPVIFGFHFKMNTLHPLLLGVAWQYLSVRTEYKIPHAHTDSLSLSLTLSTVSLSLFSKIHKNTHPL